jgi:hypothetical protein
MTNPACRDNLKASLMSSLGIILVAVAFLARPIVEFLSDE